MLSLFVCGLSWIHMFELMDDPAPTVEAFRPISYAVAIDDGQGGGWFGHTFYVFLLSQLGDYGTLSVLVAWLVVGLMLTFDVSVVELGRYLVSAFTLVGLSVKRDERAEKRAAREAAKADKMPAARPGEPLSRRPARRARSAGGSGECRDPHLERRARRGCGRRLGAPRPAHQSPRRG